jgi:hypothetical protein
MTATSPTRILSVDVQRYRVKLSNGNTVGFVDARVKYGLDPEDFLAHEIELLKALSAEMAAKRLAEAPQRPSGVRRLAGGLLVDVDPQTGKATPLECPWSIRVPSNNLEPDSEADLWRYVTCGARLYEHSDYPNDPDAFECENGHDAVDLEAELGPHGREWQREQEDRRYGPQGCEAW